MIARAAAEIPIGDKTRLVEHPGVHGSNELIPTDEVHLQGEDVSDRDLLQSPVMRSAGCNVTAYGAYGLAPQMIRRIGSAPSTPTSF